MKVVTFAAIKGGVGKTTLTFNYGEWLAAKGNKVLLIDSDHQCSLTQTYGIFRKPDESSLADIFLDPKEADVDILQVKDNLYLIPATMQLDKVNETLATKSNKDYLMFMWMRNHIDELEDFDYILIDCHPDFSTLTQNMILVSDYVFSPIEPSEYGFISKDSLDLRMEQFRQEAINVVTGETLVDAKLKYLGNRIKHNTRSSREFVKQIKKDENTIVLIPERELFNKSTLTHTPLVEMEQDSQIKNRNSTFFKEIDEIFEKMTAEMSKE